MLLARGADPNARITTTAAMDMGDKGYPTKGAFETSNCGTGDLARRHTALGRGQRVERRRYICRLPFEDGQCCR